jgi:hypothetical protein
VRPRTNPRRARSFELGGARRFGKARAGIRREPPIQKMASTTTNRRPTPVEHEPVQSRRGLRRPSSGVGSLPTAGRCWRSRPWWCRERGVAIALSDPNPGSSPVSRRSPARCEARAAVTLDLPRAGLKVRPREDSAGGDTGQLKRPESQAEPVLSGRRPQYGLWQSASDLRSNPATNAAQTLEDPRPGRGPCSHFRFVRTHVVAFLPISSPRLDALGTVGRESELR